MKTAFTLAETLITLGIIGVVAALTIPSIIKNYQKKQTAIKLKQTYSLLTQGIRMAENSLGSTEGWEIVDSTTFSETYIKPYFKVIKEYNSDELPLNYQISCNDEGTCDTYGGFPGAQKLILPNGILIAPNIYQWTISGKTYVSATIIVDINGLKPPNRYGRDVFMFNIDSKKGLVPYGLGYVTGQTAERDTSRDTLMEGPEFRACKKDGIYCAAVIMMDGWEIADDYPW